MGALMEALQRSTSKKKNEGQVEQSRLKVLRSILSQCEEHLQEPGQIYTFEASPLEVDLVIQVVQDPAVTNLYRIEQVNVTEFQASLVELF